MQTSHLFCLLKFIYSNEPHLNYVYIRYARAHMCSHTCLIERMRVKGSFWVYLVSVWVCICPELWASSLLMFYWVLTMVGLTHCLWYGVAWLKESTKTDFAFPCSSFKSELAMLCLSLSALWIWWMIWSRHCIRALVQGCVCVLWYICVYSMCVSRKLTCIQHVCVCSGECI